MENSYIFVFEDSLGVKIGFNKINFLDVTNINMKRLTLFYLKQLLHQKWQHSKI